MTGHAKPNTDINKGDKTHSLLATNPRQHTPFLHNVSKHTALLSQQEIPCKCGNSRYTEKVTLRVFQLIRTTLLGQMMQREHNYYENDNVASFDAIMTLSLRCLSTGWWYGKIIELTRPEWPRAYHRIWLFCRCDTYYMTADASYNEMTYNINTGRWVGTLFVVNKATKSPVVGNLVRCFHP